MNRNQTIFRRTLPAIGTFVLFTAVFAAVSWQEAANASDAVTGPSPTPAASLSPIPTPSPTCIGITRHWSHFSNPEPIAPADRVSNDPGSEPGLPTNYPSIINVSSVDVPQTCIIGAIAIDFAISSERPDDLDILVVDPQGRKSLVISDAGGNSQLTSAGYLFGLGASLFPDESAPPVGYYAGANYAGLPGLEPEGVDNFPNAGGLAQYTANFNNLVPGGWINTGNWKLYVVDDETGNVSSLPQGWRVSFYQMCSQPGGCVIIPTPTPTPTPTPVPICAPGTLDPSFGNGGVVSASIGSYRTNGNSVAIQSNGKLVVAGTTSDGTDSDIAVLRYNVDGSLDTSFDDDGIVRTSLGTPNDGVNTVAIQGDGKIVVAGWISYGINTADTAVVRYNPDGSLDPSFGGDGIVVTTVSGFSDDYGSSVLLQPDGKIVVVGLAFLGPDFHFAAVRYHADGSLDISFDGDGVATTVLSDDSRGSSGALQADGKIVVGGYARMFGGPQRFALVRYNSDGSLDPSFDGDGKVITALSESHNSGRSVAIQPDGKIVVAGNSSMPGGIGGLGIARYNADGSLDTSFDGDGKSTIAIGTVVEANSVAVQADGKIVVAGGTWAGPGSFYDFVVARFNADGSLDSSFDGDGKAITSIDGDDTIRSVAIQTDGRLVVAGRIGSLINYQSLAVARYGGPCGTPTPTPSPTSTPIPTPTPTPNPEFDLIISQSESPDPVLVGSALTYSLTVTIVPTGLGGSASPIIYFPLPTGMPVTFLQAFGTRGFTAEPIQGGVVRFSGGSLSTFGAPNETTATLTIVVRPTAVGTLTSTGENVIIDPFNQIPESNELNNSAQTLQTSVRRGAFDYDGDGRTDFSVFRPSSGAWYLQRTTAGFQGLQFGADGDKLTPADYDGDGKTDIAVYRPSAGQWFVFNSATNTVSYPLFGVAEDLLAPGDYDGDGKADLAVFRPSQGTWYRQNSSNGTFFGMQFGATGDLPTVGDFDGDGKNDLGIWRPSNGDWYNIRSSDGSVFGERFGQTGDKIAPADYDGDGKTDIAIFRPSTGLWVVRNSATTTYSYSVFGSLNDIPVAGDYDGDGKADIGVWRPADGTWYVQRSDNGQFIVFPWGQDGDRPTPAAYGN